VPHKGRSTHDNAQLLKGTPPVLKVKQPTRADCFLQWHAKNGHENILFTDKKIFTIEKQYNQQNKIYAERSCEVKENVLRTKGGHHPS